MSPPVFHPRRPVSHRRRPAWQRLQSRPLAAGPRLLADGAAKFPWPSVTMGLGSSRGRFLT
jgi:hypothetical protein